MTAIAQATTISGPGAALRHHWPEYLIEGWALGCFMVSAGLFATLLEYPGSAVHQALAGQPFLRRVLMGLAMGTTAVGIMYSPWGKRSGAHMNPAVTLVFHRLGKIARWDAVFYALGQVAGGTLGVLLVALALGAAFDQPPVSWIATVPGPDGIAAAFAAETGMSLALILMVLSASRSDRLAPLTGVFAGLMIVAFITLLSPLSGFGINPARSAASALPSGIWTAFWIYLIAPPLGMLLAAEIHLAVTGRSRQRTAKLACDDRQRCIHCGYDPRTGQPRPCTAPQALFDADASVGCAPMPLP